jgi:tetratricopeptide (TPR) repeat protein
MSSIDAVSSLLSSVLLPTGTSTQSADTTATSTFGPDFLMSALGSGQSALGAAYSSTGLSLIPPDSSPAGQERTAILTDANDLFTAGDYAGARAAVETLVRKYPGDATPVYLIGRSYLMEGDYKQAQMYLGKAASLAPDSTEVSQDLDAAKTLSRGQDVATRQVQQLLRNQMTAGQGLQLGAYVLQAWPENLDVRIAVADYYERVGHADYAGMAYTTALKDVPVDQQGDLVKRLEEFATAHSTDPSAHDLLAQAYGNVGRLSDAESEFQTALDLAPDDPVFQKGLKSDFASVYDRLAQTSQAAGDVSGALGYLSKAQDLSWSSDRNTTVGGLELQAGEKALQAGLTGEALSAFTRASASLSAEDKEKRDQLIGDYERLAGKLTAGGDLRRAVAARQGAYDLDSKNDARKRRFADANDAYGMWLFDRGRYDEAIRPLKAALKLYPEDSNYASHLHDAQHHS